MAASGLGSLAGPTEKARPRLLSKAPAVAAESDHGAVVEHADPEGRTPRGDRISTLSPFAPNGPALTVTGRPQ
jgi:hypothetical protein